jgi:hypothetical protein
MNASFTVALLALLSSEPVDLPRTHRAELVQPAGFYNSELRGVAAEYQAGWGFGPATVDIPATQYRRHALLWRGSAEGVADLNPAGFVESRIEAADEMQQVGYGDQFNSNSPHALLWSGSAESVVDLNPPDYYETYGLGVGGESQVGYGYRQDTNERAHALVWRGTPESVVDLHPAGYESSTARDTNGAQQVGTASVGSLSQAILWSGTAESAMVLTPTGFTGSVAFGMDEQSQVGGGSGPSTGNTGHALLWKGTPESFVDLHPAGFSFSQAQAVAGGFQAGYGTAAGSGGELHALLWQGSAASAIDLHQYVEELNPAFVSSIATAVLQSGDVVGYASGVPINGVTFYSQPVIWHAVPEPTASTLMLFSLCLCCARFTLVRRRMAGCSNEG